VTSRTRGNRRGRSELQAQRRRAARGARRAFSPGRSRVSARTGQPTTRDPAFASGFNAEQAAKVEQAVSGHPGPGCVVVGELARPRWSGRYTPCRTGHESRQPALRQRRNVSCRGREESARAARSPVRQVARARVCVELTGRLHSSVAPRGVRRGGGYSVVRALCDPEERRESRIALVYLCATQNHPPTQTRRALAPLRLNPACCPPGASTATRRAPSAASRAASRLTSTSTPSSRACSGSSRSCPASASPHISCASWSSRRPATGPRPATQIARARAPGPTAAAPCSPASSSLPSPPSSALASTGSVNTSYRPCSSASASTF
jgi:hypothetical protein